MIMHVENPVTVLQQQLTGNRPIDEKGFSAVAVLADRLNQLKKTSSMFAEISFSPDVEELLTQKLFSTIN